MNINKNNIIDLLHEADKVTLYINSVEVTAEMNRFLDGFIIGKNALCMSEMVRLMEVADRSVIVTKERRITLLETKVTQSVYCLDRETLDAYGTMFFKKIGDGYAFVNEYKINLNKHDFLAFAKEYNLNYFE